MFTPTVLTTARLKLRWLDERDAPAQFAIFSDPEIMRFINHPWTRMAQADEAIDHALAAYKDGSEKADSAFYGLLKSYWDAR